MDYGVRRPDCLLTERRGHLFGNLSVSDRVLLPDEPAVIVFRKVVNVCLDKGFEAFVMRRVDIYILVLLASCITYSRRETEASLEHTFSGPRIAEDKLVRCNSDDIA